MSVRSPSPPRLAEKLTRSLRQRRRSLVLVGLMGAGKTTIGRRLADRLGLPFTDSDEAIEQAAGLPVSEIFARFGEAEFRAGERRVLARLLTGPSQVIATGGGAFIDPTTRGLIREHGVSIWLNVPLEVLVARTQRRDTRPLLQGQDHHAVLSRLLAEREPVYAEADCAVSGGEISVDVITDRCLQAVLPVVEALPVPA